jgi:hypothetical protein
VAAASALFLFSIILLRFLSEKARGTKHNCDTAVIYCMPWWVYVIVAALAVEWLITLGPDPRKWKGGGHK